MLCLLLPEDDVHERRHVGYRYLAIAICIADIRKVELFDSHLGIQKAILSGKDADANPSCQLHLASDVLLIGVDEADL